LQRVYEWNDGTVLFAIQHKMRGVAKEWLDAQTVFQSWEQFKTALLQDFPSAVNTVDVHRELMRRKRKPNESFSEYFYIMMAIGRRANIDEPSINSYIINGLNQSDCTKALLAMNLQTCSELFRPLDNMKTVQTLQQQSASSQYVYRKGQDVTGGEAKPKGRKCFNCNQMGHIAAKCPDPQKKPRCSICSKVGHEAKDCMVKVSSVAQVDAAYFTTIQMLLPAE